jgi:hypothetical protein
MRLKNRSKQTSLRVEQLEARNLLNGHWTALTNPAPDQLGTMMLLTDGTVMASDNNQTLTTYDGALYNEWFRLTPDSTGSYVSVTWSHLASMSLQRQYFASNVLQNGNVFLVGGEYSDSNLDPNWSNAGEMYNPVANTWRPIASFPQPNFGDDPSMLLPNGQVLAGYLNGPQTYIYDPASDTWTFAANKLRNDASDEEGWVKLPDDSILSYDLFTSIATGVSTAQRYIPSQNQWVDAGVLPVQLSSAALGYELGPMELLPDGKVFAIGANGNTALYNPSTNTWAAGPQIMGTLNGKPALFGADDAPAAVLPSNGHVLFAADAAPTSGIFSPPAELFEYDPAANKITQVASPPDQNLPLESSYFDRLLVLPNGQVLFTDGLSTQLWVYTPDGSPKEPWRPKIQSVTYNGNGVFTLKGTQLNGLSAGAAYGDDVEMDSNFPIVSLSADRQVFYARSFNWSNTGVATGDAVETVNFVLPAGVQAGDYSLTVSGAGIRSQPFRFQVTDDEAKSGGGEDSPALVNGPTSNVPAPPRSPASIAQQLASTGSAWLTLLSGTQVQAVANNQLTRPTVDNLAIFAVPQSGRPAPGSAWLTVLSGTQVQAVANNQLTTPTVDNLAIFAVPQSGRPAPGQGPLWSPDELEIYFNEPNSPDTPILDDVFAGSSDPGL